MAFRTNKTPVLQEKSASGSIATFNTALAMPLASCNIAVNAWQEGTGDPSPVNVRNIVPRREVNIFQRGTNQWDEEWELGGLSNTTGRNTVGTTTYRTKNYIPLQLGINYYMYIGGNYTLGLRFYDINKNFISSRPITASGVLRWNSDIPAQARFMRFVNVSANTYANNISINYPSTDTSYHAYDANSNKKVVNLGEDTWGAVINATYGEKEDTHNVVDLGDLTWTYASGFGGYFYAGISDIKPNSWENCLCEAYKNHIITGNLNSLPNYNFGVDDRLKRIYFKNYDYTDANNFKIAVTGVKLVYELDTPTETQLTPTQIETLIGNNTIFADTGDVDLTYNDLDIAKRGSFREVFKLPS